MEHHFKQAMEKDYHDEERTHTGIGYRLYAYDLKIKEKKAEKLDAERRRSQDIKKFFKETIAIHQKYKIEIQELEKQKKKLECCFVLGKYYASTNEWWNARKLYETRDKPTIDMVKDKSLHAWKKFQRRQRHLQQPKAAKRLKAVDEFRCRQATECISDETATTNAYEATIDDPYAVTRAVVDDETFKVSNWEDPSNYTSDTSYAVVKERREKVWPVDIFGNKDSSIASLSLLLNVYPTDEICHVLPIDRVVAREWIDVAAAALVLDEIPGISQEEDIFRTQKALFGGIKVKQATVKYSKGKAKGKKPVPQTSRSRARGKATGNKGDVPDSKDETGSHLTGSGVTHFVTNMLRLKNSFQYWQGLSSDVLIVPALSLEDALGWRGEGYKAIFLAGNPKNGQVDYLVDHYSTSGAANPDLIYQNKARDASEEDIETARRLLSDAVIALSNLVVAKFTDDYIDKLGIDGDEALDLKNRRDIVTSSLFLPGRRRKTSSGRKPVCLVTFGDAADYNNDDDMHHPAPDPLLLVLKSANVWSGMCAGSIDHPMLLKHGDPSDDDDSDEDDDSISSSDHEDQ